MNSNPSTPVPTLCFICRRFRCIVRSWMHTWTLCNKFNVSLSSAVGLSATESWKYQYGSYFCRNRYCVTSSGTEPPYFCIRKQRKFQLFLLWTNMDVGA